MAVRQYIGARYVPRFVGTWNNTTQYEALDVVDNGSGTSYIARKTVPAGTPLNNTEYWFVYGASSGALIDLQNRMSAAENAITDTNAVIQESYTLKNRKFIFISDSYGTLSNMYDNVVANLNLAAGSYAIKCESGDSFVGSAVTGKFISRLVDGIAEFTNPDEITDIVIVGGLNDSVNAFSDTGELLTAMSEFNTYAQTHCPNAQIHLGYVGYCDISNPNSADRDATKQFVTLQRYIDNANKLGWHYMTNIEYTLRGWDSLLSDGVHPNSDGALKLGETIAQGILTGSCDVAYCGLNNMVLTPGTLPANVDSVGDIGLGMYSIMNNVTSFTINSLRLNFNYASNVIFSGLSWDIPITNYPFKLIDNTKPIVINVIGGLAYNDNGTTKYMQCPVCIYFMQGKIRIKPIAFINGSDNWVTAKPLLLDIENVQNVCINTIRI